MNIKKYVDEVKKINDSAMSVDEKAFARLALQDTILPQLFDAASKKTSAPYGDKLYIIWYDGTKDGDAVTWLCPITAPNFWEAFEQFASDRTIRWCDDFVINFIYSE